MVHKAKTSHIASNFSCIDIAAVLYENLRPGDEVVWSKGWVAASIYYFLSKQGKIPEADLEKFPNDPYFGLAETSINGVHVSGGSMGHGLPVAVGMALAKKRAGEPGKIYCIMSDGECNEGTTWESAAVAKQHQLDNLVVFIDKNNWQAMGKTEDILDIDIPAVFTGFSWDAFSLNGHNYQDIEDAIILNCSIKDQPTVYVANTIKGKGVSFMENALLFHYKHVDEADYEKALKELSL